MSLIICSVWFVVLFTWSSYLVSQIFHTRPWLLLFFSTGEKKRTILFYKRLSSLAAAIIKFAWIHKQQLQNMKPVFPTNRHLELANAVETYFSALPFTDTILVVNSCARGKAVPESDLDLNILVKPGTTPNVIQRMEAQWKEYIGVQSSFQESAHTLRLSTSLSRG